MHHHCLPTSPKGPKVANLSLSRPTRPLVAPQPTAKRAAFAPSSRPMAGSRNHHSASACTAGAAATPIVPRPSPKGSRSASPSGAAGALVHKTRYAWLSLAVRCAATQHQWQRVHIPVPRTARGRASSLLALSLLYLTCARALRQQDAAEVRHLLGRDFGEETDRAAAERKARKGAEALAKSLGQEPVATAPQRADDGQQPSPPLARRGRSLHPGAEEDVEARRKDSGADATTTATCPKTKRSLRFSNAFPRDEDGEEMPPNPSGETRAQWVIANQSARARAHFASLQSAAPPDPEPASEGADSQASRRPAPSRRESEWEDEAEREEDVFQIEFGF